MLLADVIYLTLMACAIKNFKKTIIIWIPFSLLFNSQVCAIYSPAIAFTVVCNLSFIAMYFMGVGKLRKNNYNQEPFRLKYFVFPMLGSILLSSLFSNIPFTASINTLVKSSIMEYGMLYIFYRCISTSDDVKLFVKVASIVAIAIVLDGIIEFITHVNIVGDFIYKNSPHTYDLRGRSFFVPYDVSGKFQSRFGLPRCYSFFGLHISFGIVCFLMFTLLMFCKRFHVQIFNERRNVFIINTAIIMSAIGVFLSNSKTPMIGFLIILLAFYHLSSLLKIHVILPLAVGLTIILLFFPEYLNTFFSITDDNLAVEGGGSSVAMRQKQLSSILLMFEASPIIGNGINSAMYFSNNVAGFEDILGAESRWFKLLADQGLLGCTIYASQFVALWKFGKQTIPNRILFFYLCSILAVETSSGGISLLFWLPCMIVMRKICILKMQTRVFH